MKDKWNLDEILPVKNFESKVNLLLRELKSFDTNFKKASKSINTKEFKQLMQSYIDLTIEISKIYSRAYLHEEITTNDENVKYLKTKANNIYIKYSNTLREFINWIKGKEADNKLILSDKHSKELFSQFDNLSYYFERNRKLSKHTLDNSSEEIITHKDITGAQSLLDLRNLTETEQSYEVKVKNKKIKIDTFSELSPYFKSNDKNIRISAYNSTMNEYSKNLTKYFIIYQSIVKDWEFERKLRKFSSNISVRNFANDIKDTTVENLLESSKSNKDIFIKFFDLKKKALNYSEFSRYDIYANHGKIDKKYSYKEAKEVILNAYKQFDERLFKLASDLLNSTHLDVYPNKNKIPGAFCANVTPNIPPFILLNYTNTIRDVFVVAHELGHAIHFSLSNKQTILTQDAPLTLAETASTFSENLVFDYIFEKEKDNSIKRIMLFDKISDLYAIILRQAYFVLFEIEAHKSINEGIKLSDFNQLYLKNLKDQFGSKIKIPEVFKNEWSMIPHIVNTPFYCYAYSFGQILALSLYKEYQDNGEKFINNYIDILSTGGSQNPEKLLASHGFNINAKTFFDNGFVEVEKWVDKLRKLL